MESKRGCCFAAPTTPLPFFCKIKSLPATIFIKQQGYISFQGSSREYAYMDLAPSFSSTAHLFFNSFLSYMHKQTFSTPHSALNAHLSIPATLSKYLNLSSFFVQLLFITTLPFHSEKKKEKILQLDHSPYDRSSNPPISIDW